MKLCRLCEVEKEETEFYTKGRWRDTKCKDCEKNKKKTAYQILSEEQKDAVRKKKNAAKELNVERNIKFIIDYYKTHRCVSCNESNPLVLEFDHLRDKKYAISDLIAGGLSIQILKEEIEKCQVLCANCHRIKTAIQLNYRILRYL
jgi:5-methylcytosine-specific restriction endonuclease McrA